MSLGSENGLSAADIAAVTDRNNGNGGWGGFGGDWLIAIIMLFLFPMMYGGWGGGMFGGMGGWGNGGMLAAANGALTRADLCNEFNFNGLENAVRGVTQGLCDGFYAMQNSINGLGMNVMQGFSQAELSRCNQQAALMQQLCNMQYQNQDCCCQAQRAIDGVNYNLATQSCDTRNVIQNTTRDIIDNQNANARAVLDALTAQRIEAKDAKIAEQASLINSLNLAQSQANQTTAIRTSIINELRNCPVGTYQVPNPNCCYGPWGGMNWAGFNGYNNGCYSGCNG